MVKLIWFTRILVILWNLKLYKISVSIFNVDSTMINFHAVLSARHLNILSSLGNGVINEISPKIFIIHINLYMSFLT